MNRNDIIKSIANDTKVPQKVVEKVLKSFTETLTLAVSCDEDVIISGFGKFAKKNLKSTVARDPRTGDQIEVGERSSIGFKPSEVLKQRLNGNRTEIEDT